MDKIHTGELTQVAEVMRSLWELKEQKDLSFGERKLMDQALYLLSSAYSVTLNKTIEEVQGIIKECLG